MTSVETSVIQRGGIAATHELYAAGHTRDDLAAAVRSRSIRRVRQGWYARRDLHPQLIEAVRVGGRLTCLSALKVLGVWSYPTTDLHVAVDPHACRLRTPGDMTLRLADEPRPVRVHWSVSSDGSRFIRSPLGCLSDLLACQPPEVVTTAADSLLRVHPESVLRWARFLERAPAAHRQWLGRVDGVCESGTESLVWFRMRRHGLPMQRQARIPGVGRVDFLVGRALVVEVDGAEYHTDPEQFENDRRRDAVLSRLGYRVLRFSYHQVLFRWQEVEDAILAAVIRGDHH